MNKYKIKDGVLFQPYGERSKITNANLTDSMAEMFIKKNPALLGSVIEIVEEAKVEVTPKKRGRKKINNK